MTIIKIIGIIIVTYAVIGLQQACTIASRNMRDGNFHGQDPKTLKFKYRQLVVFVVILWLLDAFLVVSLFG